MRLCKSYLQRLLFPFSHVIAVLKCYPDIIQIKYILAPNDYKSVEGCTVLFPSAYSWGGRKGGGLGGGGACVLASSVNPSAVFQGCHRILDDHFVK